MYKRWTHPKPYTCRAKCSLIPSFPLTLIRHFLQAALWELRKHKTQTLSLAVYKEDPRPRVKASGMVLPGFAPSSGQDTPDTSPPAAAISSSSFHWDMKNAFSWRNSFLPCFQPVVSLKVSGRTDQTDGRYLWMIVLASDRFDTAPLNAILNALIPSPPTI